MISKFRIKLTFHHPFTHDDMMIEILHNDQTHVFHPHGKS